MIFTLPFSPSALLSLFFPLDYHLIYSVLRLEKRRSAWGEKGSVKIVPLVILLDMKGDGGKDSANQTFHFSNLHIIPSTLACVSASPSTFNLTHVTLKL